MKRLLTLIGLFFSIASGFSQTRIGVVVFPQVSSVSNKDLKEDTVISSGAGVSGGFGLTLTHHFTSRLGIQTGLIYSAQSQIVKAEYHSGQLNFSYKGKKRFDYLKIPILARIRIPVAERISLVPFAGLQASILLKYDGGMIVYGDNYFDLPVTPKGNDYYKKILLEIPVGLNLEYALNKRTDLIAGLKFDYSLTNAANNNTTYNGMALSGYGGVSKEPLRPLSFGLNLGVSIDLTRPKQRNTPDKNMLAKQEHNTAEPVKETPKAGKNHAPDSITGKHHGHTREHHHHHTHHHKTHVANTNKDHVHDMFNKSYSCLLKGIVYRNGTNEVLNNTKIILEESDDKVDSSITVIGGTYTLHVQNTRATHRLYVYRKGFKPQTIELPDSLTIDGKTGILKIVLEEDGSDHREEDVIIMLNGKVISSTTGLTIPDARITIQNNMDKTIDTIFADSEGKYTIQLKKYSHYTLKASDGTCVSPPVNQSTISIRESVTLENDLMIACE